MNYNEKTFTRDVICIKCRVIRTTSDADPRCNGCGNIMITTIKSTMTDEIITGNHKYDIVIEK